MSSDAADSSSQAGPNIVLILADDMGFSDIGCYGSEIRTPNLDRLAESGVRFTQMYNAARCCPSRASLLTGVYPHQAGVGHMVADYGQPGYRGFLSKSSATIAEVLSANGYRTQMSGKWHVGGDYPLLDPSGWTPGDEGHPVPTQRGFQHFFGTLTGAGTFYNPQTLMTGDTLTKLESEEFYYTDAIADHAVSMVREAVAGQKPFFQYVAFTAPHWPLHAPQEEIARYEGMYRDGWDATRTARHEEAIAKGVLSDRWQITPRDEDAPPWESVQHKDWEDLRMAVYAAQIDRMDQAIGRILAVLESEGVADNTLVMFLSDNGGCAEFLAEDSGTPEPLKFDTPMLNGQRMRMGNNPEIRPGPADTFMSYDLPWSNVSNTPFREFKHWVHEGGVATPFIINWPARIKRPVAVHEPAHLIDVAATCFAAAGVRVGAEVGDREVLAPEGESLLDACERGEWSRQSPIFWEHEGNRAVRQRDWKLVSRHPGGWELYNMADDRTELNDLSAGEVARMKEMAGMYESWAARVGVLPWPIVPNVTAAASKGRSVHVVS
jgi:arylsulfatase A-like enzyme